MISAEYLYSQYERVFNSATPPKTLYIVEELQEFYQMAAELRGKPLPPVEFITMSHTPTYPVDAKNVLVPLSGGLGSAACLWWTLKQGYTPWVFFLDGFNDKANEAERAAVRSLLIGARNHQGLPLCDEDSEPRIVVMPYPHKASSDEALNMAMLSFMAYTVASAKGCAQIIWGALDQRRQILESLTRFFASHFGEKGTHLIRSVFPFQSPESAMVALKECEVLSARVLSFQKEGQRLSGAVMVSDVTKCCHSCTGATAPSWSAVKENRCAGCAGCGRWSKCAAPSWSWDNGADTATATDSLADWTPNLIPTPKVTPSQKRLALEPLIAAKRQKQTEQQEEETSLRVNKSKKTAKAKPKKKETKKPAKSTKQEESDQSLEFDNDYLMMDDLELMPASSNDSSKSDNSEQNDPSEAEMSVEEESSDADDEEQQEFSDPGQLMDSDHE